MIFPVQPTSSVIPYCNNQPKPKYTPKKQAQNNQSRACPLIHRRNKVVPGPLSTEIWACNDQWTENQKAYQIRQKITTFSTTLTLNNPLEKNKTNGRVKVMTTWDFKYVTGYILIFDLYSYWLTWEKITVIYLTHAKLSKLSRRLHE